MLALIALAHAGIWPVCAVTESVVSVNGGWTLVEARESDGKDAQHRGDWSSAVSLSERFGGRREEDYCASGDGLMGLTRRWTAELMAVAALPGTDSDACQAINWAEGTADAEARAEVDPESLAAMARGSALTMAEADNVADISVDAGGGARFTGQWTWRVPGTRAADMIGTVVVSAQAAYAGATLDIPGWAVVETWNGEIDAWVRQDAEWVHVTGSAPMEIPFGAIVTPRGSVCATGSVTTGSQSVLGAGGAGGAGIRFSMEPVATDEAPTGDVPGAPAFGPCGCE
ncbi:MAG: hypothetical protein FJ090_08725 [Deltaproteobacteria bacterium]|nr:hypothetical protein [Deltaproteobacteria bacterium]